MTPDVRERRFTCWLFGVLLVFNAWGISVGWNNGFLPGNEYRQTHTAISTVFIQRENNFSLAYPTPLLGKPWSIPYEFPLYQWSVVRISNATGLTLTQSARAVSATCFYLALPAVWLLLGLIGVAGTRRLLVLTLVLSCPLYVFYARAFLIETMALMFSLWFLAAFVLAVKRRSVGWLLLANLAGTGAGLGKVTTFMLYLIPAAACSVVWLWQARPWIHREPKDHRTWWETLGWIAAATVVPFAVTLWWIRLADALKALNPSSRNLMSAAMNSYHFGTWDARFSAGLWKIFGQTIVTHLTPLLTLGVFAVVAALWGRRWRKWILGCVVVFAAGPLIFPLLYSWHEYYFAANGVLLMTAVGLALCALLESNRPRAQVWLVIVTVQAAQVWTYFHVLYPSQVFRSDGSNGLVQLIKDVTGPDDILLIDGDDWAPMIPYYSQRRALMVRRNMDNDPGYLAEAFHKLQGENVPTLLLRADARRNAAFLALARKFFGFEGEPIATWDNVALYVNPKIRSRLIRRYHGAVFSGVALSGRAADEIDTLQFVETNTASLSAAQREMFRVFSPQPVRFSSRFALGLIDLNPRLILMAHPNSRLFFAPAAGSQTIMAKFGILPSAYENVPSPDTPTEGVVFSIVRLRADGSSETIFQRFLNPKSFAADRGPQILNLVVQINPGEELAFMTQPGPTGIYNRTWAYWETIRIGEEAAGDKR